MSRVGSGPHHDMAVSRRAAIAIAAVVVPARIIAQNLEGLNLRAPFRVHGMTKQILCKNRNDPIINL
jgi:hypothetical protein